MYMPYNATTAPRSGENNFGYVQITSKRSRAHEKTTKEKKKIHNAWLLRAPI